MKTLSPTLLLCLVLGLAILAGCQASDAASTAAAPDTTTGPAAAGQGEAANESAGSDGNESGAAAVEETPVEEGSAANADVEFVRATQAADGTWRFDVTVRHPDAGWEDYADGWDVVTPDGQVLKANEDDPFTRLLLHPHENEQPFTRSQSGLVMPEGVTGVVIRAHDLLDGFGGREIEVDLAVDQGPGFEVNRQ